MCVYTSQPQYSSILYIDGLMQERSNSYVLAIEMNLARTNPSTCTYTFHLLYYL